MIVQNIDIKGNNYESMDTVPEPLSTYISWIYPEIYDPIDKSYIELSLIHTRAADSIRINYDSTRDGWVIKQASVFEFNCDDKVCDQDWKEVAFIEAWARETKKDD